MAVVQADPNASPFFWYVTRTLAVGAYVTLTLTVILGLLQSIARTTGERMSWFVVELHTFVAVLTGVLIAGHLLTLLVDPFLPFSLTNILIPGNQPYKPFAVNLGVFAFYSMLAVLLSSYVRTRISYGLWRAIHYVSFGAFVLVTLHGWLAGSDAVTNWAPALYVGSGAAVGYLLFVRIFTEDRPRMSVAPVYNKVSRSVLIALLIAIVSAGVTLSIASTPSTSSTVQPSGFHSPTRIGQSSPHFPIENSL